MASSPAASPAAPPPGAVSPNANRQSKKEESIFEKLGTLTRKKKGKEISELEEEGKNAIETPTNIVIPDVGPEGYQLEEMEERSMIDPMSRQDSKVIELTQVLLDWINDELAEQRIIVKDIEEDLFDGQILQKLIEKLSGVRVEASELSQSEYGQKQKLRVVLDMINKDLNVPQPWNQPRWSVDTLFPSSSKNGSCVILDMINKDLNVPQPWNQPRWSVNSIHSKNLIAILHLLVTLSKAYRAPIRLPENVVVSVVVVQKREGMLLTRRVREEITGINDDIGARFERDAFDTLFDHAPDKLVGVKKSLLSFVNKHLNKINLEVTDLDSQFHDGVFLVLLLGLLDGYFVPLYSFFQTPETFDQKVHNVTFSFELMQDAGLPEPRSRPEDIVNLDLKCTLRVLYNIFKHKSNVP